MHHAHDVLGAGETQMTEGDAPPTVLVVDDEPSVLRVTAKVVRLLGYTVLEANGAEQALQAVSDHEGEVDLLVTDIVMPGMNGRELAEVLGARHPKLQVLFMSGYTEDEVVLRGVRFAEVNFLAKPFSVSELREKVEKMLDDG